MAQLAPGDSVLFDRDDLRETIGVEGIEFCERHRVRLWHHATVNRPTSGCTSSSRVCIPFPWNQPARRCGRLGIESVGLYDFWIVRHRTDGTQGVC